MSALRATACGVVALAWLVGPVAASGASAQPVVAAADNGKVDIVDTETVQVYLDSSGKVDARRVYEQLVLRGDGKVTVTNPVSTQGLRNLDGFGSSTVKDGAQVATYDVDGVLRTRTVSDYTGELPLAVSVRYLLDGKEVEPGDVIGADGLLEVAYTIKNRTLEKQDVTIPDGKGGTTTRSVDVAVPFAGSLTTTLPENFTAVEAPRGVRAGDGRGGTKLSFTLTLFPPIGAPETTVGWTARVRDGVVPRAELTALPVDPLRNPSFGTAVKGYEGGRDKGVELASGAEEMDANLLRLRDGAESLLGGLLQLHDGADQLRTGLQEKAVPGARKLADGTSELDAGLARLDAGTGKLAGGAKSAAAGSRTLRDGLVKISAGLGQLAAVDGLPAAKQATVQLQAGVGQLLAGLGAVGSTGTLLDGLARLEGGLGQLSGGLAQLRGDGSPTTPGLVGAKGGVDQVTAGLSSSLAPGGSLDQLAGGLAVLKTLGCIDACSNLIDTALLPGLTDSRNKLTQAVGGLQQVSGGLGQAIGALNTQLIPGADALTSGATAAKNGATSVKTGLGQVSGGLTQLETGLAKAVAGILALDTGAGDAATGAGSLASGLGLLESGASELADGAGAARDGSSRIASGAGELATKLGDAADGSAKIADGLGKAADGAPQIVDGAGRLSKEGAQVIVGKGEQTAQDYGELLAVMQAGSERAAEESMAFGAPEGATGLTAYSFILQGDDGAGGRNLTRGLLGGAMLGLGSGAFFLRRRLLPV